jgi:hypothetical protein
LRYKVLLGECGTGDQGGSFARRKIRSQGLIMAEVFPRELPEGYQHRTKFAYLKLEELCVKTSPKAFAQAVLAQKLCATD